jgi:hypothetical protein
MNSRIQVHVFGLRSALAGDDRAAIGGTSGLGSGSVIAAALADVCFRGQSGKHLLASSFSAFDSTQTLSLT